jgi:hypothetical protein
LVVLAIFLNPTAKKASFFKNSEAVETKEPSLEIDHVVSVGELIPSDGPEASWSNSHGGQGLAKGLGKLPSGLSGG